MVPLHLAFRGLARAIVAVWRDPETKAPPFVAGALVEGVPTEVTRTRGWLGQSASAPEITHS